MAKTLMLSNYTAHYVIGSKNWHFLEMPLDFCIATAAQRPSDDKPIWR
jgi:hypothetical protein